MKHRIINIVLFLFLWQVAVWLNIFSGKLPSLLDVCFAFGDLSVLTEMIICLLITFKYIIISLLIGVLIGYFLGIIISLYPKLKHFTYDYLNGIKSVPVTILLPLLIAIFGIYYFSIPTISLPIAAIMAVNIGQASEKVNKNRQSIVKLLSITKFDYWLHILRWETLDDLFASLRIVITYAIALQIAFEYFLAHLKGIGRYIYLVYNGSRDNKLGETYAAIILVAFIGILLIKILDIYSKKALKWKTQI
jgi:ABC-type nitrate/sulfonate/bicarbonate transport system permease component